MEVTGSIAAASVLSATLRGEITLVIKIVSRVGNGQFVWADRHGHSYLTPPG